MAEMWNLRGFMKSETDPVTDKLADNRTPLGFGVGLDFPADIADGIAGLHCGHASSETFPGDLDNFAGVRTRSSGKECLVCIGIKAV